MTTSECPVPAKERTVGYIHGWNKVCKNQKDCLPYPKGYLGVRYAANGKIVPPNTTPEGKRIIKPAATYRSKEEAEPALARPQRRRKETTEQKLARARKKALAKKR